MSTATLQTPHQKDMLPPTLVCLAVILSIRLVSLWFNNSELFFDEAQYWYWSQDLAFGYFSKPPVLAGLVALTTSLCGSDSEFCIRLSAPLLHTGTAIFIYLTARRLFDPRTAFWSSMLYATLPGIALSSTLISTDIPLLFFWSAAFYFYVRLTQEPQWRWAIFMGIALGLAFNSKYAAVYFLGCALLHAVFEQQQMTPPRRKVFWGGVLIAVLMIIPNALWNLQNGFATLSHTGDNIGWSGLNFNVKSFFEFFGSQFGVFGPILFGMYLATLYQMKANSISYAHRLLVIFSLPILTLIMFQALMSKAYANWAAAAYIAGTILVAEILVHRVPWAWLRTSMLIHVMAFLGLAVAVCYAGAGQIILPSGKQPFERTQGSKEISDKVRLALASGEFSSIITTNRRVSAILNYNLRDLDVPIFAWRSSDVPRDHYQLVAPWLGEPAGPALYISRNENIVNIVQAFETVTSLGPQKISAGEIDQVYLFRLEGYRK